MLRLVAIAISALAIRSAAAAPQRRTSPWRGGAAPPPVASFEPLRYVGRWFQM